MTDTAVAQLPQRLGQAVPLGLLNLRLSSRVGRTALASPEAVTQGLATAKVFAFASADYPGAALSMLFDSNGTTAVGAFEFDSTSALVTAFTFTGGAYEILSVPGSIASYATGINSAGLIVGTYEALGPPVRGFVKNGSTFSDVVFPSATATQAIGINDAGQIVDTHFVHRARLRQHWRRFHVHRLPRVHLDGGRRYQRRRGYRGRVDG